MIKYPYLKGKRLENKIVKKLKERGQIAFRSAGSHSPIDVIGIDTKFKIINLIQCKSGKFTEKEKFKLIEENRNLNGTFEVKFFVEHQS